jgi:hypothetical protein
MRIQWLFLVWLFGCTAFGQSYIAQLIPGYENLSGPPVKSISVVRTDSAIQFTFHSTGFTISQSGYLVRPLITARRNGRVPDRQLISAAPFFPDAECKIVSFDADQNGVDDLFIVFPYSLTGTNPNIDLIAAYFFFPDSSFKFVRLRSYYGDIDLFRDFNHDGKYEYACINELSSDSMAFDVVNLFAMTDGEFTNITKSTPGFPIVVVRTGSGLRHKGQLPPSIAEQWYLKAPDVLSGTNAVTN